MAIHRKNENDVLYLLDGSTEILSIAESLEGTEVMIKLSGMLRSDTAHDFQDELIALTTMNMNLVLDMANVSYISSTCQQVLLSVQQKMDELEKGSMLLTNLNTKIKAEFDSTGFSQLLNINE